MQKLDLKTIRWINSKLREVSFYGTPEKCYTDSGFWLFVNQVLTKDEHDPFRPVKPIDVERYQYLQVIWLHMLHLTSLWIPKSRQTKLSWAVCIFAAWIARTAPHRRILFQSYREEDAEDMVTKGRDDPMGGRISLIENELPNWLRDPNIIGGKGNRVGELIYYPNRETEQGITIPWYGSRINALPQGMHKSRGKVPSLYIGDEVGIWEEFKASWSAVAPAVDSGLGYSKMFAVSSVYRGSEFNDGILEGLNTEDDSVESNIDYSGIPAMDDIVRRLPEGHLPRGLRSFVTMSGNPILEVHYSADPDKRPETEQGASWLKRASSRYTGGVKSPEWQREMEIRYNAAGGFLIFPELSNPLSKIWHRPLTPRDVISMNLKLYGGYDFGQRSSSAFTIWGQSPERVWYLIDEIYEPCLNYVDHCRRIKENPYVAAGMVKKIVCDPQMSAEVHATKRGNVSTLSLFEGEGVMMTPGLKGADMLFMQLLKHWWSDPENIGCHICENCWNSKREFQGLRWHVYKNKTAMDRNQPEKIMDKNNHTFDSGAYLHATMPKPPLMKAQGTKRRWYTVDEIREKRERDAREEKNSLLRI